MLRYLVILSLLGSACRSRTATVRVSIPDLDGVETPAPGLMVSFLPYNRDSIVTALEGKAGPRPHVRELDSLFRAFRIPFVEYLRANARLEKLRSSGGPADSVARVSESLITTRAALARAREELWPLMTEYRAVVHRWEDSVYRDYSLITRSMGERVFANSVADTTDALGWATIILTGGRWWATARSIDPTDPNAEWYWNVPISGDTVFLSPQTGRRRPRY